MSIYLAGALWVGGAALVGAGIGYLVRRFGQGEGCPDNNDAAGQVFTIVAGLHAVLMAFILISLYDSVGSAQKDAQTEADSLVAATWAADALPGDTKDRVHQLAVAYGQTVVREEWPRLDGGGPLPETGWSQLDQMRRAVAATDVDGEWLLDRKTEASNRLWSVYEARQQRLSHAGGGVGAVVWFALILGSVVTALLLPNLFGGTRLGAHIIIVATMAGTITLLLFAIHQLQNPFSGGASVQPDAFTSALERLA